MPTSSVSTSWCGSAPSRARCPTRGDARRRSASPRRRPRTNGPTFRAAGKTYDFLGWRRVYVEDVDEGEEQENEARLPVVAEGESVACNELVPVSHETKPPARVHRGQPRQGARGARHRSSVHVRRGDRDDPGARLRVAQGHRARAQLDRVRRNESARAALRPPRRLRLHRDDGRSARRDRTRRG